MSDFKRKTVSGLAWSVANQLGKQGLNLAINVGLMRMIVPEEYGLITMITVFSGFAAIFTEFGLGAALVQKRDVGQEHLSSVFWLHLGMGAAMSLAAVAGAPLVAAFYGEPRLVPLMSVVALGYFISSLNIVQNILLAKALNFKKLSIVEIAATGAGGAVALAMAYLGFGVWSLAANTLAYLAISAALLWTITDWRPTLAFKWGAIRELLGFGSHYFGTQAIHYWAANLDNLLLGKFLADPAVLGRYNRAYGLMLLPLTQVSMVVSRVMFPAFSSIQDNKAMVKDIYLQLTRTIILLTFPMMFGLWAVAEPFVYTLFTPTWKEMIPLVRIMCFAGMIQSMASLNGNLFLSQGRADLQFRVGLLMRSLVVICVLVGINWGVMGVAWAMVVIAVSNYIPSTHFAGGLVGLRVPEAVRHALPTLGCAAAMALVVRGVDWLLPDQWLQTLRLGILVACGAAVYLALIHAFGLRAYGDLRRILGERLAAKRKRAE